MLATLEDSFHLGRVRFVFGTPLFYLELVDADTAFENGSLNGREASFVPEAASIASTAVGTIASFQYRPRNTEVRSI